jgi:integration host factor subunit beta
MTITKSQLIQRVTQLASDVNPKSIESAVQLILDELSLALVQDQRIEVRGFGSFSLHRRSAGKGRNPRTGELIDLDEKIVPHFKPGKALKDRVNEVLSREIQEASKTGQPINEGGSGLNQALMAALFPEELKKDIQGVAFESYAAKPNMQAHLAPSMNAG